MAYCSVLATLIRMLLVSSIVLLVACQKVPIRHPFANSMEPKLGALPTPVASSALNLEVAWERNLLKKQERFSKLQPFFSDKVVFAADYAGTVVALNRENGKKEWRQVHPGKKFTAGPFLMDDLLLLATKDAKLVALHASTGHFLWETSLSSGVLASPIGGNGVLLVHAMDGSLTGLDKRGTVLWRIDNSVPALTLHYSSVPVIVQNKALVGFATGKLLAIDLRSGIIEWEKIISMPRGRSELQRMVDISADPLVKENTVYVITYQGKLAAVNIDTGDLKWEREVSAYQNMAIDEKHLYITDNDHALWAIERESGATVWKQERLAERYITAPTVTNNLVVVGDKGGYLHFLLAESGKLVNQYHVPGKFYQAPISMGNRELLLSTHNGKVLNLRFKGEAFNVLSS